MACLRRMQKGTQFSSVVRSNSTVLLHLGSPLVMSADQKKKGFISAEEEPDE